MSLSEFLIALITHASWPIAVVTLAWMFRDAVNSAFERLESANSKYLKLILRSRESFEYLSRAEGIADTLGLPQAPDAKRSPKTELDKRYKQLTAMSTKKPREAMFDAWDVLVEQASSEIERKKPDTGLPWFRLFLKLPSAMKEDLWRC